MLGNSGLEALGLNSTAEAVYQAMLDHPGWGVADLAHHLTLAEHQVRDALDDLFTLSLLRESIDHPGQPRAVHPQVAVQSLLAQQQAELARRQQEVATRQAAIAALAAQYADLPPGRSAAGAERLVGMDTLHDRLEQLSHSTRSEVLSLMPGGAHSAYALQAGRRNDTRLRERGVAIRTVLQDSARNDRATLAYAQWLTDTGGEVRTAAVLPLRMLIVDRTTALVPIDPDNSRAGAVQLTQPGVVAALVALFDQVWTTAVPLGADRPRDSHGLTQHERELLKLLAQGHTDESAAKRLGTSERSARRTMAALMERLGAHSRFEAGLRAAQHGWI